ncbi:MAG: hypothetical protein DLM62_09945 [Pseudonocardiales bacterium]|nr:MAG: hypothetical protein DLM62_09945 [Pseudonocardiales bacterium]
MIQAEIPRVDQPGPDAAPRSVQFRDAAPTVRRRGFLAVVGTAGMTLGLTMLGWIPLARSARAEQGSEYLDCGHYSHRPGSPICYGAPYSASYCGSDRWFKSGCYGNWKDGLDCYQPRTICRAGGEARNGWRWKDGDTVYRCADGEVHYNGAPNLEQLICSATLSED